MNITRRRYFGGAMKSQEKFLNRMAAEGHRLVKTGKLTYEFAPCAPGQYEYRLEYIGHLSRKNAEDYASFLRDCGYQVFYKNINVDWNVGKIEYRPWAQKGGRLAANETTLHRELLIVEKEKDGRPFDLHTTPADQALYRKALLRPWLYAFACALALSALFTVRFRSVPWAVAAGLALLGLLWILWRIGKENQSPET